MPNASWDYYWLAQARAKPIDMSKLKSWKCQGFPLALCMCQREISIDES